MAACFYSDESAGWAYEAVPPAEASALSELASRSWVHFDAQLPRYWFRNSDGRVFLCVPPKPRSPVSPICGALRYSFTLAAGSWRVDPLPPVLCSDHSQDAGGEGGIRAGLSPQFARRGSVRSSPDS